MIRLTIDDTKIVFHYVDTSYSEEVFVPLFSLTYKVYWTIRPKTTSQTSLTIKTGRYDIDDVLIQITDTKYLFVGRRLFTFELQENEKVLAFNYNLVRYMITEKHGEQFVYFLDAGYCGFPSGDYPFSSFFSVAHYIYYLPEKLIGTLAPNDVWHGIRDAKGCLLGWGEQERAKDNIRAQALSLPITLLDM
jgi:hypothetical protein